MAPKLKAGESGHSASASSSNAKGSSHAGTSSHHASSSDRNQANGTNTHSTASDRGTPGASERSGVKDEKSGSGGSGGVKRKAESQVISVRNEKFAVALIEGETLVCVALGIIVFRFENHDHVVEIPILVCIDKTKMKYDFDSR